MFFVELWLLTPSPPSPAPRPEAEAEMASISMRCAHAVAVRLRRRHGETRDTWRDGTYVSRNDTRPFGTLSLTPTYSRPLPITPLYIK